MTRWSVSWSIFRPHHIFRPSWSVSFSRCTLMKASHAYENSYDLDYDDGDAESRVPARYVRPLATAAPTPLTTTSRAPPSADLEPEL